VKEIENWNQDFFNMLNTLADSGNDAEDQAFLKEKFPEMFENVHFDEKDEEIENSIIEIPSDSDDHSSSRANISVEELSVLRAELNEMKTLILEGKNEVIKLKKLTLENKAASKESLEKEIMSKKELEENEAILSHRLRMLERHQGDLKNQLLKSQQSLNEISDQEENKKNKVWIYGLLLCGAIAALFAANNYFNSESTANFLNNDKEISQTDFLEEDLGEESQTVLESNVISENDEFEEILDATKPVESVERKAENKLNKQSSAPSKKASGPVVVKQEVLIEEPALKPVAPQAKKVVTKASNPIIANKPKVENPKRTKAPVKTEKVNKPKKKTQAELYYERLEREKANKSGSQQTEKPAQDAGKKSNVRFGTAD